jgi:hypothetical protein
MMDPVLAMDGVTYERTAIEEWLAKSTTSPFHGGPLESKVLIPNVAIRQMISDQREARGFPSVEAWRDDPSA